MAARRAVILARGLGTRMRRVDAAAALDAVQAAAADAGAKALMPIGGAAGAQPLVAHLLTAVADAGLTEVVLVVGPEHGAVAAHFAARPPKRLTLRYAVQAEPLGTGDAVFAARAATGEASFVVLNGDTWYPPEAIRAVADAPAPAFGAFDADALVRLGNIPAERVAAFAVCEVDADGALRTIVEKPEAGHPLLDAASRVVSMNLWHLPAAVHEVLPRVARSSRGEVELPDAVRLLMADGARVRAVPLSCGLLDLSTRADVASIAARLADRAVAY